MLPKQPENFLNRVTQALNRPMQSRCAELTVLFDRGNIKDLHTIFPTLIDSIFGPQSTICWELRTLTNTNNQQDFQALQHFLSPLGPMFKIIYTLLRDPLIKFEFSLSNLPLKIQQNLNNSTMHPFYADLVNVDPQTNRVISLMLNPFDFYFFHFAYHLISPFHQHVQRLSGACWNTVYYVLCCDYVLHFLPTNPSHPVLPILTFYNGKNPIYTLPSFNKPIKTSKLFRMDNINVIKSQALEHHPRNEIWRSETIITVFIDMWLNNDQVLQGSQIFDRDFDMSAVSSKPKLRLNDIPTGEYIRIIRMLVKQLHAFSSSAKADDTHMGELKKIVIPYLQGKMYVFLRHLIHRWPLDGSFRLVLELWVSFIQPWRYPGDDYMKPLNQQEINPDLEEIGVSPMKAVDREHLPFIAENLLAYTVILQQLLPRFTRVDLSSPKIALLLYRLTKVFAQPNLVQYLREVESSAMYINNSPLHLYNSIYSNGLPPLSPTSSWSTNTKSSAEGPHNISSNFDNINQRNSNGKWVTTIKQKILEYEGMNFCYKPIFCLPTAPEIFDLLRHIKQCEDVAQLILQSKLNEMNQHPNSFWGTLKQLFFISEASNDEFTIEERTKVPTYLHTSLKNLIDIFNISEVEFMQQQQSINESQESTMQFQRDVNDINALLTPARVRQRVKTIKYEGDPDLYPVRSDESKVLVRLLYQLSSKINEDFQYQINRLYYQNNFAGRLSRQLICPPITIYKYEKSQSGNSPRVQQQLPARFSFRYFASYKFLFYLIVMIVLSKLFGYGYFTFIVIGFVFWFSYACLKALCDGSSNPVETQPVPNIRGVADNFSFNESF